MVKQFNAYIRILIGQSGVLLNQQDALGILKIYPGGCLIISYRKQRFLFSSILLSFDFLSIPTHRFLQDIFYV